MKQVIVIAGAPGSGKSTVARALQQKLGTPLFEFGWIPEFRNTGSSVISYHEDETLAFENLMLVTKNYIKHGFSNIILTDLENERIALLADELKNMDYNIFTLRLKNDELLKARVLNEKRSSGYRDWQSAQTINAALFDREPYENEVFIDVDDESIDDIIDQILGISTSR